METFKFYFYKKCYSSNLQYLRDFPDSLFGYRGLTYLFWSGTRSVVITKSKEPIVLFYNKHYDFKFPTCEFLKNFCILIKADDSKWLN